MILAPSSFRPLANSLERGLCAWSLVALAPMAVAQDPSWVMDNSFLVSDPQAPVDLLTLDGGKGHHRRRPRPGR